MTMEPHVEKLPVPLNQLGEGPHWDSERQTLYYVDMPGRTLQRYVPSTKDHARSNVIDTDAMPSFIIPLVGYGDLFAVNLGLRVHVLRWNGQNATTVEFVQVIAEFKAEKPNNMLNDGKVDLKGRLFTGTIGVTNDAIPNDFANIKTTNSGSFYSISSEGAVKKHYTDTDAMPSFIIPLVGYGDLFAVNLGLRVHVLRWNGQNATTVEFVQVIAEFKAEKPNNMLNDGKVDLKGRLFTGTIGVTNDAIPNDFANIKTTNSGSFYSISSEGAVKKHYTGVTVSNGIVFDVKRKALYHNDTSADVIRRLQYDVETGETANKTDHFNFKKTNTSGYPDGMAGDTDGNLWVASYKGSCVVQINPETCQVLQIVKMPVHHVTSLTFGGPNLNVMFVTTAHHGDPTGGGTYAVTGLGVKGYENLPFDFKGLKLK